MKKKSFMTTSIYSEADTIKLIHELRVHQIELEMQNEELMRAEEEANIAIRKYTELYDFAPSGYFTLSKEGKIVELNLKGASMLGKERQRLLNSMFRIYLSEDTRPIFNRFLDKVILSESEEHCEVILPAKVTGMLLHVQLTGSYDQNNEFCKMIMVNITENKKAEKELREIGERLVQLNADKDRFISILSHDLISPFNVVLGFSELLSMNIRTYDIGKIEDISKQINNAARNSYNLLGDILMWARAHSGKIPFRKQILDFGDICTDILETLHPNAEEKNIRTSYNPANGIHVFADIDMVKTVLRNLVSNAIKFTNCGGEIHIHAVENSENVTISVSDNGIGMPPENLAKLFNISEVLTTKGTAEEKGTGLGLIICKEFIEKHGGTIWVESVVGKGSTFKFTLPCNGEPEQIQETAGIK